MDNNRILGLIGTVLDLIIRVAIIVVVVYFIYNGAQRCYDLGYRVFTEEPMSKTIGREITVTVPVDYSVRELGEMFEEKGLTRDKYLLMLQYYASEYRKEIRGGTYTLDTTMTAEEMFAVMAGEGETDEEEETLTVLENHDASGDADEAEPGEWEEEEASGESSAGEEDAP